MKAKLIFDLDDEEDRRKYRMHTDIENVYSALGSFSEVLRKIRKYDHMIAPGMKIPLPLGYHTITEEENALLHEIVENIANEFYNYLESENVDTDLFY